MTSEVVIGDSSTTFSGPDAVNLYRAITLKAGLRLYGKTGIKPNRNWTSGAMLKVATEYTGKNYKRGEYLKASEDLTIWIETMKLALPTSLER